jgi:hypothetical protein
VIAATKIVDVFASAAKLNAPVPFRSRGRFAIVTMLQRDAMDALSRT